jgi:hypothetical protein
VGIAGWYTQVGARQIQIAEDLSVAGSVRWRAAIGFKIFRFVQRWGYGNFRYLHLKASRV